MFAHVHHWYRIIDYEGKPWKKLVDDHVTLVIEYPREAYIENRDLLSLSLEIYSELMDPLPGTSIRKRHFEV